MSHADTDDLPTLPIASLTVTTNRGATITVPGDAFLMGAVHHDVNSGTLTITLCDVIVVETDYVTGRTTP